MGKKNILIWAILLMILMGGTVFAEENKSKEQMQKELIERLKAEAEKKKKFKIQVIKEKEVQFLDDNRQVRKRISLETKREIVTEKAKIGNTEKGIKVERATSKHVRINPNGKFAALITNVEDMAEYDEKGNAMSIEGGYVSGKIALMDENGNMLWEKQLPDKRPAGEEPFIADNGETVAVEGVLLMGGESGEDPANMFVFNKSGNEILRFPGLQLERLSPNGKYLAATVAHGQSLITRFYNLINKKYWDSTEKYTIFKLSDDGLVRADTGGKSPIVNIDLKNYIGD